MHATNVTGPSLFSLYVAGKFDKEICLSLAWWSSLALLLMTIVRIFGTSISQTGRTSIVNFDFEGLDFNPTIRISP